MLIAQLVILTLTQASNMLGTDQNSQTSPNYKKTTVDGQQLDPYNLTSKGESQQPLGVMILTSSKPLATDATSSLIIGPLPKPPSCREYNKTTVDGEQLDPFNIPSNLERKTFIVIHNACYHSTQDTCSLVKSVVPPSDPRVTHWTCKCDKNCTLYNDCCRDSQYRHDPITHHNFSCEKTPQNGYIYMKTSCPPLWNQSEPIRQRCEVPEVSNHLQPVTDSDTGITYRNMYCALCHQQLEYDFLDWGQTCKIPNTGEQLQFDEILHQLSQRNPRNLFAKNGTSLRLREYVADNTTDYCWHREKFVTNAEFFRHCVPSVVDTCSSNWTGPSNCSNYASYAHVRGKFYKNLDCLTCNYVPQPLRCNYKPFQIPVVNVPIEQIPIFNITCNQIPKRFGIYKTLCPEDAEKETTVSDCKKKNPYCQFNRIYSNLSEFEFLENEVIVRKESRLQFSKQDYILFDNNTKIYICGHILLIKFPIPMIMTYFWLYAIPYGFSIVCLVVHLFLFQHLYTMKTLSEKNMAAFSFNLLLRFVLSGVFHWLNDQTIADVIMHYLAISGITWMLILSYDCWRSIYRATTKLQAPDGSHSSRFIKYCIISWTGPFLLVGGSVLFELAPPSVVPCYLKSNEIADHGIISSAEALMIFYDIPAVVMLLGVICFFTHTAFMIFLSKRSTINPTTRNYFKLYIRLAIMVDISWTIDVFVKEFYRLIIFLDLFTLISLFQGIFIFFAFSANQKTLKQLRTKHKNNPKVLWLLMKLSNENV